MAVRAWDGEMHAAGGGNAEGSGDALRTADERGATMVELGLVLAVVFMLLTGVIQFGVAFNSYQAMQAAAREGGRFGAKSQATLGGIEQRVKEALGPVNTSGTNWVSPCPGDPSTLAEPKVCVNVHRIDSGGATTLLTTSGFDAKAQPCNLGAGNRVIVTVHHTIPLRLAVWPALSIKAQAKGEFRCQS